MGSLSFDLGALALRLALGLMLISHGLNKLFGSGGIAGTARWFESLGLRPGWLHARVAAATELTAGALMATGLAMPLAAAAFVGIMVVAAGTDHRGKGFFVFKGGCEYVALVAVIAVAICCLGPGNFSLDHLVGTSLSGVVWSAAALVVGVLAATPLIRLGRRAAIS